MNGRTHARRSSAGFPSRAASVSTAASATTTTGWEGPRASTTSSRRGARTRWWTPRVAWLAAHPGDVFVWVHLFDPHAPVRAAAGVRGRRSVSRRDRGRRRRGRPPARRLGRARRGRRVVALTADHGEAFGEHGEESHSLFVYDVTLRVPLVLKGAGVPRGRARGRAGVDRRPRRDARCRWPARRRASRDAACWPPSARPRPLYAETLAPRLDFGWSELRSIRVGRYKLIRAPRPELYDVEADPGGDAGSRRAHGRRRWRGSPRRSTRVLAAAGEAQTRRAVDPETAERLRSLGYVQGIGERGTGADPKDKVEVARRIARAAGPFRDHARPPPPIARSPRCDPDVPVVNFRLADALLRSGRAAEAIPYYRKVHGGRAAHRRPVRRAWPPRRPSWAGWTRRRACSPRPCASSPRAGRPTSTWARSRACGATAPRRAARYEAALADPVTRERAQARLAALPMTRRRAACAWRGRRPARDRRGGLSRADADAARASRREAAERPARHHRHPARRPRGRLWRPAGPDAAHRRARRAGRGLRGGAGIRPADPARRTRRS